MQLRSRLTAQVLAVIAILPAICNLGAAQQTAAHQNQGAPATQTPTAQPAIEVWGDEFDGDKLDEAKWGVSRLPSPATASTSSSSFRARTLTTER